MKMSSTSSNGTSEFRNDSDLEASGKGEGSSASAAFEKYHMKAMEVSLICLGKQNYNLNAKEW